MNKIYLITGASSDLSVNFIKDLERQCEIDGKDCLVYGTYNSNSVELQKLADTLKMVKVVPVSCNLSNMQSVNELIEKIKQGNQIPTHFLHVAASKFDYMRIKNFDWDKTKQELDIQVGGFANICKWLLPQMSKQKYGRVVAVLSAYTLGVPPKFMSDYVLTKYALLGFVKAAASEYAGKGISINAISPNMMETKFLTNIDSRMIEANAANSAMKRNVELQEVTEGIQYLMSNGAAYLNGINLNLSGGDNM